MASKIILAIGLYLLCSLQVLGQIKVGFELNGYSSKLIKISPDTIVPYGYSGAKVTQSPSFGIAPALVLRTPIRENLTLETGLGYWSDKYKLQLQSYSRYFGTEVDSTLNISLKYIQVPILLNYEIPMKGILSLVLSGGIRSKILIHQKDNYQDIIFEEVFWPEGNNSYKRIVLTPSVGFAGKWKFNNGKSLELGLFGSRDATPFAYGPEAWGFFYNLYPSRSLQTGISMKFFL